MTAVITATAGECSIATVERELTAVAKARVPFDRLPEAERSLRAKIDAVLPSLGVGPLGRAFTLWRPPADGLFDMEPGVIVSRVFAPVGEVVPSILPAGRTAHLLLRGPYDGIPGAWQTLFDWSARKGLKLAGINWQIYGEWNDDPAKLETSLYALSA